MSERAGASLASQSALGGTFLLIGEGPIQALRTRYDPGSGLSTRFQDAEAEVLAARKRLPIRYAIVCALSRLLRWLEEPFLSRVTFEIATSPAGE